MKTKNRKIAVEILKDIVSLEFFSKKKVLALGEGNIISRFVRELNYKKNSFSEFLGVNKEIKNTLRKKYNFVSVNMVKNIDLFIGIVNKVSESFFVKTNNNFYKERILIEKSKFNLFILDKKTNFFVSEVCAEAKGNLEKTFFLNKICFSLNKKKNGNFFFNEKNFLIFKVSYVSIRDLIIKNSFLKNTFLLNNSIFNIKKNYFFIKITNKRVFFIKNKINEC